MVRKVTPKPATGSTNCSLKVLPDWSAIDVLLGLHGALVRWSVDALDGGAHAYVGGPAEDQRCGGTSHSPGGGHRRHGEAAGQRGLRGLGSGLVGALLALPDEEEQQ